MRALELSELKEDPVQRFSWRKTDMDNSDQLERSPQMIRGRPACRSGVVITLGFAMASLIATHSNAQGVHASVNSADLAAAAAKVPSPAHLFPALPGPNTDPDLAVQFNRAAHAAAEELIKAGHAPGQANPEKKSGPVTAFTGGGGPPPMFDPAEVSNPNGGRVISSATQYNIYLGCGIGKAGSCWGNPAKFESDLNNSDFIKVLDQYAGSSAAKRYPVSSSYCDGTPSGTLLYDSDIVAWLTSCYRHLGSHGGPNYIYNIFLASGIDVCQLFVDTGEVCYAPYSTEHAHLMCGYHSHTMINSYPVYYTVVPYQAVKRCYGEGSDITNATANVLSHEIFELVSDPELTAWLTRHFLLDSPATRGPYEIGDLCAWELFNVNVGGTTYKIQQEYSNKFGACATSG
jgi:hypothetical protein